MFMQNYRHILLYRILFWVLLILALCRIICCIFFKEQSKFSSDNKSITGYITNIKEKDKQISLEISSLEKIIVFVKKENFEYQQNDLVLVEGKLEVPSTNMLPNLFNYKEYLNNKHIFYVMYNPKIKLIKKNNNILFLIKNNLIKFIKTYNNSQYIMAFIFGDTSNIDIDLLRDNGISHLVAISGMHLILIIHILEHLFKRLTHGKKIIISILLLFYGFLIDFTPSFLRVYLTYVIKNICKSYDLNLNSQEIFNIVLLLMISINPKYIYNMAFLYSFSISFAFIQTENGNFIKTSILAFFVSLPISACNFYKVNFLAILFNILFIPYVTKIIFPFTLIYVCLPFLDFIYAFFINLFIESNLFFRNLSFGIIGFPKVSIIWWIIYYLLLFSLLKWKRKYIIILITLLLLFISMVTKIDSSFKCTFLNVGQGDSILLVSPFKSNAVLIDTGGNPQKKNNKKVDIIDYLYSIGVYKLDSLILSHGDYDHMGEAINLVNNFKVEKVIFNCGPYNELEKELIDVLNKKKIEYYSCIKELNIDKNKLYFLQTKEYDNENDNSNVIYTEFDGYKFMFMGDASSTIEKEILNKYNLPDIDVLKVGHHGSKTSSSNEFINEINPKYSIISVGKNNRYGHPNKEVLDNLKKSKIYRTDQDGSIMFKIKNNKLKIDTCSP